jgi:hypothetical protein
MTVYHGTTCMQARLFERIAGHIAILFTQNDNLTFL